MDSLTDFATWLAGQWSWVTVIIVVPATWFLGRVGILATKRTDAWLERKADEWASWRKTRNSVKRRNQKVREREALHRRLESERVGALFRVRETKDDPGTIIEVIGLDRQLPEQKVRTRPVDTDEPRVTRIAWRQLTKPPEQQRHETAQYDARSDDDADGWLRYERVDSD